MDGDDWYNDDDGYELNDGDDGYESNDGDDDGSAEVIGYDNIFDDVSTEIKNYKVLKKDDIIKNQEHDITHISSALSVSKTTACVLLLNYAWNVEKVQDVWFDDKDRVQEHVGLMHNKPVVEYCNSKKRMVCGICFETYAYDKRFKATVGFCGHRFCSDCLKTYVSVAIDDGPACLFLRCPDPSCRAVIGEDMVNLLVSDEVKEKYDEFMFRSYVENNKNIKWCPAPDCKYAIEYEPGSESYEVVCDCSFTFCWNCSEDYHHPTTCETVGKWKLKNCSESENMTWILGNSKPCPKCRVPIEKGTGCMHMTCKPPCGFEFCWICLGPYEDHNESMCNRYNNEKGEDKRTRKKAERYSIRYAHYYERWIANQKSREKAIADLREIKNKKFQQLEQQYCLTITQLNFIVEAWEQIVECRRALKWTYAYGYYIGEAKTSKTELFEYLQGEAEAALERLHDYAENNLNKYVQRRGVSNNFDTEFKMELRDLTYRTRNYFENFMNGVANDLSEAKNDPVEVKE